MERAQVKEEEEDEEEGEERLDVVSLDSNHVKGKSAFLFEVTLS